MSGLTVSKPTVNRRLFLAGLLALGGCSVGGAPRDSFYRLAESSPPVLPGGPIPGVIDVPPFRAAGIINERSILFRSGTNELSQYSYHYWFEPPGALLQRAAIDALRASEAFEAVTSPELRLDRDYELLGNIRRLEHVPSSSSVIVEIDVSLRRVRGNEALILKTYEADAPTSGGGAAGAVAGFSQAVSAIFTAMLNDIAAVRDQSA